MKKALLVLALALTVASIAAFADDLRVPQISNSANLASLQSILDSIYGCSGCINAATQQQAAQTWYLPGNPPQGTLPILQATNAADGNAIGIYSGANQYLIFTTAASAGTSASLTFNVGGTLTISGSDCSKVNCVTVSGIDQSNFGFFINDTTAGATFYTQDALNPNGSVHALSYLNTGVAGNNNKWTIAFNDAGGDQDFDDRVFSVESIVATPEPASIMLLGVGLLGFGKKMFRK